MKPIKYAARTRPDLKFWAEMVAGQPDTCHVVSQVDGFPATEADDDWYGDMSVADAVAQDHAKRYKE